MGKPLLTFTSPGSHAGLTTFLSLEFTSGKQLILKHASPMGQSLVPGCQKRFLATLELHFQCSTEPCGQCYQHLLKSFRVKYQLSGSWTVFKVKAHFPQTILQLMILPLNLMESDCCNFLRKCLNPH